MSHLTIGMACANDWQGVWGTLVTLREVNRFFGDIIVVNNNPKTAEGKSVGNIAREWGAKHIEFDQRHGTSAPRDEIFRHSKTKYTLVIDPHVYIPELGQLEKIVKNGQLPGAPDDLYHGPILFGPREYSKGQQGLATHMLDSWGPDRMWGEWAMAWAHETDRSRVFDIWQGDNGECICKLVQMDPKVIEVHGLSGTPFSGHRQTAINLGYRPMGTMRNDPAFEIPGMGMGLYLAKTDSWLGFHPLALGFGGEEMTIHEYYRDNGRKVWCLPWLHWHHRFTAEHVSPGYRLIDQQRARNYVLSINRLKNKDSHFERLDKVMREWPAMNAHWDNIVADPEKECSTCPSPGSSKGPSPFDVMTRKDVLSFVRGQKRDIDQQVANLLQGLAGMDDITLVVKRREWEIVALETGANVRSYNLEVQEQLRNRFAEWYGDGKFQAMEPRWPTQIEETDALVLDTQEFGERLYGELLAYGSKVRKRIVIHATNQEREIAPGNQAGLMIGLRKWLRENPEWMVKHHSTEGYGLTIISRESELRRPLPSVIQQGINYASAMAIHFSSGAHVADETTVNLRLDTCALCPMKTGVGKDRCAVCGCYLAEKATLDSSECPLGYWGQAEQEGKPIVPPLS